MRVVLGVRRVGRREELDGQWTGWEVCQPKEESEVGTQLLGPKSPLPSHAAPIQAVWHPRLCACQTMQSAPCMQLAEPSHKDNREHLNSVKASLMKLLLLVRSQSPPGIVLIGGK